MGRLYLDLLWRWKWALAAGGLISSFLAYRIVEDPQFTFLARAGSASGVNELILASLWGSLLLSIDSARGTARVWATLPIRSSRVSLAIWGFSVLTFPLISALVFTAIGIESWLDGGDPAVLSLVPLLLLDTISYSGFAHLFFCEFRSPSLSRWRRESARAAYLLLLGGFYLAIRLYPFQWEMRLFPEVAVLLAGLAAGALGISRTSAMLSDIRSGGQDSQSRRFRSPSFSAIMNWVRGGPILEGALFGALGAAMILAPLSLIAWVLHQSSEFLSDLLNLSGWSQVDIGFSSMVFLTFGAVFVAFYAAHPWMDALRALRSLPYGPHHVASKCLLPAIAACATLFAILILPMAYLLGPELREMLWFVGLVSPGLAIVACAAYIRWGYAVVIVGVFGLIPMSIAIRSVDPSMLLAPPIVELGAIGATLLVAGYLVLYGTILTSTAAYRRKHVPWF